MKMNTYEFRTLRERVVSSQEPRTDQEETNYVHPKIIDKAVLL